MKGNFLNRLFNIMVNIMTSSVLYLQHYVKLALIGGRLKKFCRGRIKVGSKGLHNHKSISKSQIHYMWLQQYRLPQLSRSNKRPCYLFPLGGFLISRGAYSEKPDLP